MLRLPRVLPSRLIPSRVLPSFALACCLALPPVFAGTARADDTAAPAPAPAPAPDTAAPAPAAGATTPAAAPAPAAGSDVGAPPTTTAPPGVSPEQKLLRDDVDSFFHYAWIGRYDLAAQFCQKVVDEANDPAALIPIIEYTARRHDENQGYMAQLLRFRNQKELQETTDKLLLKVQAGHVAQAENPDLVAKTVRDMSASERAYENNLPLLRKSGELAVPIMLDFLRINDEEHKPYRGTVRRALVDMGRVGVNPLLAATDIKEDIDTLLTVINSLGSLGYDAAGPYLARVAADKARPEGVRNAASSALAKVGVGDSAALSPGKMFYALAERFYYGNTQIGQVVGKPGATPGTPVEVSYYWSWDEQKGLTRKEVPAAIFSDLMAMRSCENALALQEGMPEAVSLWLDADNKREADLPAGATDAVNDGQPSANFYNLSSGARHLRDALARALKDRNAAVALKLTRSLGDILGPSSMSGEAGEPLTDALKYPDKIVRYEAAFALASGLPAKPFDGQDRVVPLLIEALGQGGKGNVLILGPSQDDANKLQALVKGMGYVTAVAATPGDAVTAAGALPSVDVILFARGMPDADVTRMLSLASSTPRLQSAAEIIMSAAANGGTAAAQALGNPQLTVTTEVEGDALKAAIEAARKKGGAVPLDDKQATEFSTRAASLLGRLAISRGQVLDVSTGEPGLLGALNDPRPDLVAAVGNVLAHMPSKTAQQGLAAKAIDPQTGGPAKTGLFQSLATSAKSYGNQLDPTQVSALDKEVSDEKDPDIRAAAAAARGALNLPTDDARKMILDQAKK